MIGLQSALVIILVLALTALAIACQFSYYVPWIAFVWICAILSFWIYREKVLENVLIKGLAFAFILCVFLNLHFYPHLLQYQSGMLAGKWLQEEKNNEPVLMYKTFSYSLDFYVPGKVQRVIDENSLPQYLTGKPSLIYCSPDVITELRDRHYKVEELKSFDLFRVSRLDLKFINHQTRESSLQKMVLARISGE